MHFIFLLLSDALLFRSNYTLNIIFSIVTTNNNQYYLSFRHKAAGQLDVYLRKSCVIRFCPSLTTILTVNKRVLCYLVFSLFDQTQSSWSVGCAVTREQFRRSLSTAQAATPSPRPQTQLSSGTWTPSRGRGNSTSDSLLAYRG